MTFTKNSQMVKSILVLLAADMITVDDIPNLFNLREIVLEVLGQ